MTPDHVKGVTEFYRRGPLKSFTPKESDKSQFFFRDESYAHARWMLDKIDKFMDEGRPHKAMRWLGFVQGILWGRGIYTIDQMRKHNLDDELDDGAV